MKRLLLCLASLAIVAAVTFELMARLLHPWYTSWGATEDDRRRPLPGDGLAPGAVNVVTRAIAIDAPAERTWSWLIQLGQDRAGFYSYRLLENLVGADMPAVERIVPEWQKRDVGETLWLATPKRWGEIGRQVVAQIEPGHAFSLVAPPDWARLESGQPAHSTWSFCVEATTPASSRLLVRSRYPKLDYRFDLIHFIMERGMLLGIKARAERPN